MYKTITRPPKIGMKRNESLMGLFDKIKGPVFLKENSEAERQLAVLQELRQQATAELADQLDEEIRRVDAGIFGEKAV